MDTILAEIAKGEWFVSMECLFAGFDYSMRARDGTTRVVARNEQTAFLTKHLRAYGGTGEYQGAKVGRLLRNIVFSGKGLVRKPANPESVILTDAEPFSATKAHHVTDAYQLKDWCRMTASSQPDRLRLKLAETRLGLSPAGAAEFVAAFVTSTGEQFAWQVELAAKAIAKSKLTSVPPKSTPVPLPPKGTPAPLPPKSARAPSTTASVETDDAGEQSATDVDLSGAVLDAVPTLSTAGDDTRVHDLRTAVAAYFGYEDVDA
ncbi:hypothetical protein [Limnoglobus roseus]|uniref:Uncharacterized protein n=1 Tax=Limnoglobus roseus TaxID=2598579 RepID=A0A5C1ANH4_9BACT|nr:hypothetical protein [Limnoglobus roseus]QEL19556.1 hypothetical protein PX52LOC_06632 [Limnoglobus roseus]